MTFLRNDATFAAIGTADISNVALPAIFVAPSGDTTGATDVANINAALTSAHSNGVPIVRLGSAQYYVNASIAMKYNHLALVGAGGDYQLATGTVINSLFNGPAILVQASSAYVNDWNLSGLVVITPASGTSAIGIVVDSSIRGGIRNVTVEIAGSSQIGLLMKPTQSSGSLLGTQQIEVDDFQIFMPSGAASSQGIFLTSLNATANSSFNQFSNILIQLNANTQTALHLQTTDSNYFYNFTVVSANGSLTPTSVNFDYSGPNTSWPSGCVFVGFDDGFGMNNAATHIINSGTPTVSTPNTFYDYSDDNGSVFPFGLANTNIIGKKAVLLGLGGQLGYMIGAGGAVTQTTSITTAVTLNKICGTITTISNAFTEGTVVQFAVNNSLVASTDVILLSVQNANYSAFIAGVTGGQFGIAIDPLTTSTVALVINFAIIKAVNS